MPSGVALKTFRSQEAAVRDAHECHATSLRGCPGPWASACSRNFGMAKRAVHRRARMSCGRTSSTSTWSS